uniref:Uncharacterized protein n=1 Tax=Arundo donax TaxID=35708 RepID=A0A0A9D5Z1_ARUDO
MSSASSSSDVVILSDFQLRMYKDMNSERQHTYPLWVGAMTMAVVVAAASTSGNILHLNVNTQMIISSDM